MKGSGIINRYLIRYYIVYVDRVMCFLMKSKMNFYCVYYIFLIVIIIIWVNVFFFFVRIYLMMFWNCVF